jgi:hypothetical protein
VYLGERHRDAVMIAPYGVAGFRVRAITGTSTMTPC